MFGIQWPGGYAEYALAPVESLMALPDTISFEAAAVLQATFCTSYRAVATCAQVTHGDTILINSVSSGIGTAALQVAEHLRLRVIVSSSSDDKLDRVNSPAVIGKVNYRRQDVVQTVMDLTDGHGADAVIDCAGGELFTYGLAATAVGGVIVTLGAHATDRIELPLWDVILASRSIIGSVRATAHEIHKVLDLAAAGSLTPIIDQTYPLAQAHQAHQALQAQTTYGKLVLSP